MEKPWQDQLDQVLHKVVCVRFDPSKIESILTENTTNDRIKAIARDSIRRLKYLRDNNRDKYRTMINRIRSANA